MSTEYDVWVMKWKQQHTASADILSKLVDALHSYSELQFPNLHVLLQGDEIVAIFHSNTLPTKDFCNKFASKEKIEDIVRLLTQLHPRRMKLPFMLSDSMMILVV